MTRRELEEQNAQLVELLTLIRDLIDHQLEQIGAVTDEDPDDSETDDDDLVGEGDEE